jgi:hypothetical protein
MSALPCVRARDRMGERREDSRRRSSQELLARTGKGCYIRVLLTDYAIGYMW